MATEYKTFILVPKERIGALIGKGGKTKRKLEESTGTKIEIDSDTGEVDIIYTPDNAENAMKAKAVVTAVARGFSPEKAIKLLNEDYYLELINLPDIVGKSKNALIRQRARIIGSQGKARKMLETLTGTDISVFGKTVAIMGPLENVEIAKTAVEMLARGTPHGDVYKYVQKRMEAMMF